MAVQLLDTQVDFVEEVPTLSDIYSPGPSVKFGGLEAVPASALGLETQICRSIYPLRNLYDGQFSSAVLLSRYRYCRYGSYLYFGVTATNPATDLQSFELLGLRNTNIKVNILQSDQDFDVPGLQLFCFISREDFSVSKLAPMPCSDESVGQIFAGFQLNSKFEWDDIENEYADYYPISDSIQRIYSGDARLGAHTSYAYSGSDVSWARSEEDFLSAEEIRVLTNIPLRHILPGSAVLNNHGQVLGLVAECWRQDIAPMIDLVSLADKINICICEAIESQVFRSFDRIGGTQ